MGAWYLTMSSLAEQLAKQLGGTLVQTHASWAILLDEVVYKIKKPVNFGFLDYSTLEKRRYYCEQEVKLNQRLCKYVYLGVVPISVVEGVPRVEDHSAPVEYAVKMRRIPDEALLINQLPTVTAEQISQVAEVLYRFHQEAEIPAGFDAYEAMFTNVNENFEQTKQYVGITLSKEDFEFIKARSLGFLEKHAQLMQTRQKQGYVRDGHGDVRCEHVAFLDEGVCIYDCIEFNDRFRYGDVINDMCFLSMELDYFGYPTLAKAYEQRYAELSQDPHFDLLVPFFKSYRAYVRGKVTSFTLDLNDPDPNIVEKASRFFKLARRYLED